MQARVGRVLVVDDDALNRRLLTSSLEREGHSTTAVEDGGSALAALAGSPFDLVLLDILMPGLDGIEVLERLKQDPALLHIPVIMISGVEDTESIARCIEAGAEDFLPKPFDPVILRARVNAGLNRKALHDLERERVRQVFTRFLPESLVDQVLHRNLRRHFGDKDVYRARAVVCRVERFEGSEAARIGARFLREEAA